MMGLLLQQIAVAALLVLAAGYMIIHYWRKQKVKTGCAACKVLQAVQEKRVEAQNINPPLTPPTRRGEKNE